MCPGPSAEAGNKRGQRRLNFTVCFVLALFAFIYWTVVFASVRARWAREARGAAR